MSCQIGIYQRSDASLDDWNALIHLQNDPPPRDLLRQLVPFLREFQAFRGMEDAESLGAWLTWHLIDSSAVPDGDWPRVALTRQIETNIDYFCRVSPGVVEVYSIDEVLDWRMIAAMEISPESVGTETRSN